MNSKSVGDISESSVIAAFIKKGVVVLTPFGDNQRYDLVIDRGRGFERVQVKTAKLLDGYFRFECASSYAHRGGGRKDYKGQIDLFAVYLRELDSVYIIPIEDAPKTTMNLRLDDAANKQTKNINYASKYIY